MSIKNQLVKDGDIKFKGLKKYIAKKIIIVIAILVSIILIVIGIRKFVSFESKTTKIGFENIGELATQAAYVTNVNKIDDARKLFKFKIPFTQSKYIYSYDLIIKAGFDFGEIEWDENNNVIEVRLPEMKILSSELDLESFKVYHEEESIFNEITMTDNNESLKELKKTAEEDAIANGLLENARTNAEMILTSFFASKYDLEKYEIVFKDKQ